MAVMAYTKSGVKAAVPVKLDKTVFGVDVPNHELIKQAYLAYLASGRVNLAKTKKRGEVSGGGQKPWRQKGTGRARFGSSRNPIWRGGGVAFGPTGDENYNRQLPLKAKRQALRQALSLAAGDGKIKVIETFACPDGKVKPTVQLLKKIDASGNVLIVVSTKDGLVERATRNLPGIKAVAANYLNTFDVLNADGIVIDRKAIEIINQWLGQGASDV